MIDCGSELRIDELGTLSGALDSDIGHVCFVPKADIRSNASAANLPSDNKRDLRRTPGLLKENLGLTGYAICLSATLDRRVGVSRHAGIHLTKFR